MKSFFKSIFRFQVSSTILLFIALCFVLFKGLKFIFFMTNLLFFYVWLALDVVRWFSDVFLGLVFGCLLVSDAARAKMIFFGFLNCWLVVFWYFWDDWILKLLWSSDLLCFYCLVFVDFFKLISDRWWILWWCLFLKTWKGIGMWVSLVCFSLSSLVFFYLVQSDRPFMCLSFTLLLLWNMQGIIFSFFLYAYFPCGMIYFFWGCLDAFLNPLFLTTHQLCSFELTGELAGSFLFAQVLWSF